MTSPFFQNLDPQAAPDPVTPHDSPSNPAGYASVTPHGPGTAPYDIQAPMEDLAGAFQAAGVAAGAETSVYPSGPRQAATEVLLASPQGFSAGSGTSGYDILEGFHAGGGDGWPADVQPGSILETPAQGQMGTYPRDTGTD
jgi:hypothetical protein